MKYVKPKIALCNLEGNYKEIYKNNVSSIKDVLESNGFEIVYTKSKYPRNDYVHDGNSLIKASDYKILGEGRYVIEGKDFVLISSLIKESFFLNNIRDIQKYFFKGKKIYFVEPINRENELIPNDMAIDLTIGSIPHLNILTVDFSHIEKESQLFRNLRREHGTTIIYTYINQNEKRRHFNNYLVVNDFVLTDSSATVLNQNLKTFGINLHHIDVQMEENPKLDGSIRCLTNIIEDKETKDFVLRSLK